MLASKQSAHLAAKLVSGLVQHVTANPAVNQILLCFKYFRVSNASV